MTNKTFGGWIRELSWLGLSGVALIGYLNERQWFISATNLWFVGVVEGSSVVVAVSLFAYKYGDSIAEAFNGLRERGRQKRKDETA